MNASGERSGALGSSTKVPRMLSPPGCIPCWRNCTANDRFRSGCSSMKIRARFLCQCAKCRGLRQTEIICCCTAGRKRTRCGARWMRCKRRLIRKRLCASTGEHWCDWMRFESCCRGFTENTKWCCTTIRSCAGAAGTFRSGRNCLSAAKRVERTVSAARWSLRWARSSRKSCLPEMVFVYCGAMNTTRLFCLFRWAVVGFLLLWFVTHAVAQSKPDAGWPNYGSDAGGTRYSNASQIDPSNVAQLKVAWTFRTGANDQPTKLIRKAAFEATPILVDGKLYFTTPYDKVFALNPGTGAKLWEYDPGVNLQRNYSEVASRGVSAWHDTKRKRGQPCRMRILFGTLDARLIALDGETGKPCLDFGTNGEVNLN